jgi:hypothetical protein
LVFEQVSQVISRVELLEHLSYNPETGALIRKIKSGKNTRLGICGGIDTLGYVQVQVLGKMWRAHRLIWLLTYGEMPKFQVDHVNGVRHDNRLSNLRQASNAENMRNRGATSANTSGFKGVTFNKNSGKWMAQIMCNGKNTYLGLHSSAKLAHAAYVVAANNMHNSFARTA